MGALQTEPWQRLLEHPTPREHIVQLYGSDSEVLAHNVGHYLWEGLKQGHATLVVATREHREAFVRRLDVLGADSEAAVRDGQLVLVDAVAMLPKLMRDGQPSWELFDSNIGVIVRALRDRPRRAGLRAYGELVGLLWEEGKFSAAMILEEFWNRLLESVAFNLYCAYPIDVLGKSFQRCDVDGLLCSHTHFVPAAANGDLEGAISRAMQEIVGPEADRLEIGLHDDGQPAWAKTLTAEALILWIKDHLPEVSGEILARARQYYQPSV